MPVSVRSIKIQIPNKNLKWETSGSLDIALEGRLFNRFNFSLDFFNKTSKDLLFTVHNPLSAGATDWFATSDETPSGMSQYFANKVVFAIPVLKLLWM